jgi:succinate dehydrogenase (ubiquinone) cytochrome b560 subunit
MINVYLFNVNRNTQVHRGRLPFTSVTAHRQTTNGEFPRSHLEKNQKTARPLSPHLSIFRLQLTSVLSFTTRATGVALTVVIYAGAISYIPCQQAVSQILHAYQALQLPALIPMTAKIMLAWPFCFHTLNGIRHLVWDTGMALSLKAVYVGGWIVTIGSFGTAIALALLC